MEINEEERSALDQKFGGILVVATAFGDFAFRSASEPDYRRFNKENADPETKVDAFKVLCKNTVVWPEDKEALMGAFAKRPGLIHTIGNQVLEHSGLAAAAARKK